MLSHHNSPLFSLEGNLTNNATAHREIKLLSTFIGSTFSEHIFPKGAQRVKREISQNRFFFKIIIIVIIIIDNFE